MDTTAQRISPQLVLDIFNEMDAPITNDALYRKVADRIGISSEAFDSAVAPVGASQTKRNLLARRVRWAQQTLRHCNAIEKAGRRGQWRAVERNKKGLTSLQGTVLLGFSTNLGLAIWGDCRTVFEGINEPVTAIITSPPYLLARPRDYGNPKGEQAYIDFICSCLEPIIKNLVQGGTLALNVGADVFVAGTPARSLYRERLTLALCDRFGLWKMDELIWNNSSRPPGPFQWASKRRMQLNFAYEPILLLTNDPLNSKADNRRVLEPHSKQHEALIARGGETRNASYANGAWRVKPGSFSGETKGRIPKNVLTISHNDKSQRTYKAAAASLGLPVHGAAMPLDLAKFLVRFLTAKEDVVVDPFAGPLTIGRACEALDRAWIAVELMAEYLRGGAETLTDAPGFEMNPEFERHVWLGRRTLS